MSWIKRLSWITSARRCIGFGPAFVAALLGAALLFVVVAEAATCPKVRASPSAVSRGRAVTLSGSGWYLIEYCEPRVTLTLRRSPPLGPLLIARVRVDTRAITAGTFHTSWTVPRSVHVGRRTILATQRCHSGRTGAAVFTTRSTALLVR